MGITPGNTYPRWTLDDNGNPKGMVGPDGEVWGATYAKDSSGNVTGLVGAGGEIMPMLGANTITVGAGGMYATIAAAIANIPTAEMFVPITLDGGQPASATDWTQYDPVVSVSNFSFSGLFDLNNIWFKLASDSRLYPIQSMNAQTPDSIISRVNRIETSVIGATEALTFYRAVPVKILLLDPEHEEKLTISVPVSLRIDASLATGWYPDPAVGDGAALALDTAASYFDITIGSNIRMLGGAQPAGASTATSGILVFDGTKHRTDVSDLHSFESCGTVEFLRCDMTQQAVNGLGHFGLTSNMPGDLILRDCTLNLGANRSGVTGVKAYPFDSLSVRKLIVDGLGVVLDDKEGRLTNIGLFNIGAGTVDVSVSNVTVNSKYASTAVVAILDEMPYSTPDLTADTSPVHVVNCHIGPNFTGATKKIYRASTGGSARVVKAQCCSGGDIDAPSVGSKTVAALAT